MQVIFSFIENIFSDLQFSKEYLYVRKTIIGCKIKILMTFKNSVNSSGQNIFDIFEQVISLLTSYLVKGNPVSIDFSERFWLDQEYSDIGCFLCTLQNWVRLARTECSINLFPKFALTISSFWNLHIVKANGKNWAYPLYKKW